VSLTRFDLGSVRRAIADVGLFWFGLGYVELERTDYLRPIIADGDAGFVFISPEDENASSLSLIVFCLRSFSHQPRRSLFGHEARQTLC